MTAKFWIPGQLPSMNDIIKAAKKGGKGMAYARMKRVWTEKVCCHAKAARVPKFGRVRLSFLWVEPERGHPRDRDNIEAGQKFVWDGLVLAKVIPNDTSAYNAGSEHHHEAHGMGHVEVTITSA